jgi:hypothetical protein
MARFFFHLTGRLPADDDDGEEFSTPQDAMVEAKLIARDLALNRRPSELEYQTLRVTDEAGAELASFHISDFGTYIGVMEWFSPSAQNARKA